MSLDTRNKNIYGVGISMSFEVFDYFLGIKGERTTPYGYDLHTIRCYLIQEIRIYIWYRGGDLNSFRDIWALPVSKRDRITPYGYDLHHQLILDTRKNLYGLGVGTSTVFEIFGHFLFKGDGTILYGQDLHAI
jgi:hypothetical protein